MGDTSAAREGLRSAGPETGRSYASRDSTDGQRQTVGATLFATTRHSVALRVTATPTLVMAWAYREPTFSNHSKSYVWSGMWIPVTSSPDPSLIRLYPR